MWANGGARGRPPGAGAKGATQGGRGGAPGEEVGETTKGGDEIFDKGGQKIYGQQRGPGWATKITPNAK